MQVASRLVLIVTITAATAATPLLAASLFAEDHHDHAAMPAMHGAAGLPTLPGQDAFGAVQEIVRLLEADPRTDWSKVDLEALRQHLIDMNEVTLKAEVATETITGGLRMSVTGSGRTVGAIERIAYLTAIKPA